MSGNSVIKATTAIWAGMIALSVLHPVIAGGGPTLDNLLDALVVFFAWQAMAFIVAVVVLVLRGILAHQLTGAARWLGFVPPAGSGLLTLALVVYGQIAP